MAEVQALAAQTGRREQTKAADRLAILGAARAAVGEIGYEAGTVRDIIRRTELSVGAFYNYVTCKEQVFEGLADDGARRFRPILRAAFEWAESFEGCLRHAVSAYFRFLVGDTDGWHLGGLPALPREAPATPAPESA